MIDKITHDDPLIEIKVNFFAAYYNFAAANKGKSDLIPIDNPLSLVEKALFQIEHNAEYCNKYLCTFLDHPLLRANNKLVNQYLTFKEFKGRFKNYKQSNLDARKLIIQNSDFVVVLRNLQTELKEKMFEDALKGLIKMLQCSHPLERQKEDIITLTNVLITEFAFQTRTDREIKNILSRLFNKDVDVFPMPEHLRDASDAAKEEYISNRNFEQQFRGIINSFKEPLNESRFIFKVSKFNVPDDFVFTYDRVTFYSIKHPTVSNIVKKHQAEVDVDYFNGVGVLATIKSNYYTLNVPSVDVLDPVKEAIQFVNIRLDINCYLEQHTFLVTKDFKDFGFTSNRKSLEYDLQGRDIGKLLDNPYTMLKDCADVSKQQFLMHEKIYMDAFEFKNPTKYWQYLEAIIPTQFLGSTVIHNVSKILLLNAESYYQNNILRSYLFRAVSIMNFNSTALGISAKTQLILLKDQGKEIERIKEHVKIPFVKYLLKQHERKYTVKEFCASQLYYTRVLSEVKAERNSDIHAGIRNFKSLITLNDSIRVLTLRLRWLIIDAIQQNDGKPYDEIVKELAQNGALLKGDNVKVKLSDQR